MAKDRIERDELASKLIETAGSAEDPFRVMGSEQASLTGFKGSIVRKAAVGRSASNLQNPWPRSKTVWRRTNNKSR